MKTPLSQLISEVTKGEGKKKSVSVGNVREVLKCLKTACKKDPANMQALLDYLVKG